jgi:hypothetical protein
VEEHEFWARHFPGLRALKAAEKGPLLEKLRTDRPDLLVVWEAERAASEKMRDALRHFSGMATGHPDLFRAFLQRFTELVAPNAGHLAVVLPGDAFKIKGGADLRAEVKRQFSAFENSFLTNKAEWVFERVDERKLISLFTATTSLSGEAIVQVTRNAIRRPTGSRSAQIGFIYRIRGDATLARHLSCPRLLQARTWLS